MAYSPGLPDRGSVSLGVRLDDVGSVAYQLDNAAAFYAMFGRENEALDLLEETVGQNGGFNTVAYLTHSPDFVSLAATRGQRLTDLACR